VWIFPFCFLTPRPESFSEGRFRVVSHCVFPARQNPESCGGLARAGATEPPLAACLPGGERQEATGGRREAEERGLLALSPFRGDSAAVGRDFFVLVRSLCALPSVLAAGVCGVLLPRRAGVRGLGQHRPAPSLFVCLRLRWEV